MRGCASLFSDQSCTHTRAHTGPMCGLNRSNLDTVVACAMGWNAIPLMSHLPYGQPQGVLP